MKNKTLFIATATLIGTIIGAGILGLPYVIAKAGFLTGIFTVIFLGLAITLINLYVGEISLRTKGRHEMSGLAEKYLGKWGKALMTFSMIFVVYGMLTAYIMAEGQVLNNLFGLLPAFAYSLIFFAIISIIIYLGLRKVGESELWLVSIMLIIIIIIVVWGFFHINPTNLNQFDYSKLFLPYGVIMFAFFGSAAIPEMRSICSENKHLLKKAIIIGSLVPIVIYILYALVVVGSVGPAGLSDGEISTTVLDKIVSGKPMQILGNLFAVLSMFTSAIAMGLALLWVYHLDLGINRKLSFILTLAFPLALALSGLTSFIAAIAIAGAFAGGLQGILVVLMYWKAKKYGDRSPEFEIKDFKFTGYILILLFTLGIVYTFLVVTGLIPVQL
ncbi:aromatic amino acid transport family protein [Nanoarchaeota archaeon]